MVKFVEEKTKALPVLEHRQSATIGRSLKSESRRFTVTLELRPERSSGLSSVSNRSVQIRNPKRVSAVSLQNLQKDILGNPRKTDRGFAD